MSRNQIISNAVAAGKSGGMKKPFDPKRVAQLHQGQNSLGQSPNQGRPGKPKREFPGGPILSPGRRKEMEAKQRETGYAA